MKLKYGTILLHRTNLISLNELINSASQGKLSKIINFSFYPTTTDSFNPTLLEFCPEVVGKIGYFPDISSGHREMYLVNYVLLI